MAFPDSLKPRSRPELHLPTSGLLHSMAHIGIMDTQGDSWRMGSLVEYISSEFSQISGGLTYSDSRRPKSGTPNPFTMISNDSNTLRQLNEQVDNPNIVMLSDWSHFTSDQLQDISIAADIDPL